MSADEMAAASSGVDLARAKLLAFVLGAIIAGIAGASFASICSYVDSEQSDFTVSAMVLAMVIVGGAGSVRGAVLGALAIAGYNQLVIPRIGGWLVQAGQTSETAIGQFLASFDLRNLSYLFFGLALYFTVLLRARDRPATPARPHEPPPPSRTFADTPGRKPVG
jgi:branched-chain amino acid transport system permease protein